MKIILENNQIKNLEILMKDAKWYDYPSDESLFCFSYRFALGTIDGIQYGICESHKCGGHRPARILIRTGDKNTFLEYKTCTPYHRESHLGKTFIRPVLPGDNLIIEWPIDGNQNS